ARLKLDYAAVRNNLGSALASMDRWDEAIAEFREAIRLKPDYAEAHCNLGIALRAKGRWDEAIAEFREPIRLEPDYAEAHCNLGGAMLAQGKFREALEAVRRGHELGSRKPGWRYPSAQWVREGERLIELDGRLPGFLERKNAPANPAEGIELAE